MTYLICRHIKHASYVLRTVPTYHHHNRHRHVSLFLYCIVMCVLKEPNIHERMTNKWTCSSKTIIGAQAHPNATFSTSNGLARDWTRVTAVKTRRLAIWATARPKNQEYIVRHNSCHALSVPSLPSRLCFPLPPLDPTQVSLSIGPANHP